ncbi:MAG: HNH endonuclease [Merismopedia sp. SIO2A8]|nr:HNH endonuclease [Merismopedia sp. SIO2A8]
MNALYPNVAQRANHRCEYCKAPEVVFNFPFEVEHVVPICLNGSNDVSNLALACRSCNLRKGMLTRGKLRTGKEVRFFHPRKDQWNAHFQVNVDLAHVQGITPIGKVTVDALKMNTTAQVKARKLWVQLGLFP